MALEALTDIKAVVLRGGCITAREKALLPFGAFSMVQNERGEHPGFQKRAGCRKSHDTADSTNEVLSLYQFSKGKRTERHFFAQMGDNDVLEKTTAPPGVETSAVFGSEVFDGAASSIPASWSNLADLMFFSNGVDQHKVYAGTANYVRKFIKFDGSAAPPTIPTDGFDYTKEVTDGSATTHAILDSLNTYANHECIFICTPVPANRLTWTFISGHENATAAIGTLSYRKSDNTWADTTEIDGTIETTGKTLGKDGSMTWTHPTDEIPSYMFGVSGFWLRWETATQLDAEVEVSGLTYGSGFSSIVNVWDGVPVDGIEAQLDHDSEFYTHATDSIEIGLMDENDKLYFNSADPILGVYVDVGETPAGADTATIDAAYYWDGDSWVSLGTVTDGTNKLKNSGWVTWGKPTGTPQMSSFKTSQYYSYWYYLEIADACSAEATPAADDVIISLHTMPYFDIDEFGIDGYCNCAWKDRIIYTFGDQFLYVSGKNNPLALNGLDFTILIAGDGRNNKVVNMKRFHNELLVFQEEKGKEGGCITLFEGYSPNTFGRLVLSSQVGTLNAKSVVVVDGVMTSTDTERPVKTLAFTLSHYGVIETDGRILNNISDDIKDRFDPRETSTCIRRGYESKMWMEYDSSCNCLRLGLVCGASATKANIFPVFDLTDRCWYFDSLGQNLSCMTEVEAASGDLSILQYGGGTADGFVCQLNYGTNDISSTDLITNGTFASDTGWTKGTGWSIAGGVASCDGSQTDISYLSQVPPLTIGKTYRVVFTVSNYSAGNVIPLLGSSGTGTTRSANGTYDENVVCAGNSSFYIHVSSTFVGDIDNVICTLVTTTNPIDAYITPEFSGLGEYMNLRELLVGMKTQTAGNLKLTVTKNAISAIAAKSLSMVAEVTNQIVRRHRVPMDVTDQQISVKLQHNTASQACYLEFLGVKFSKWKER